MMNRRSAAALGLVLAVSMQLSPSSSSAQTQSAPGLPQQPSQVDPSLLPLPNDMAAGALKVIQMIESKQAGDLWDGGSAVMKKDVTRAAFMKENDVERAKLGATRTRTWVSIVRGVDPPNAPAGRYITVRFNTQFANSTQLHIERVTFRQDEDDVTRLASYVLQKVQ